MSQQTARRTPARKEDGRSTVHRTLTRAHCVLRLPGYLALSADYRILACVALRNNKRSPLQVTRSACLMRRCSPAWTQVVHSEPPRTEAKCPAAFCARGLTSFTVSSFATPGEFRLCGRFPKNSRRSAVAYAHEKNSGGKPAAYANCSHAWKLPAALPLYYTDFVVAYFLLNTARKPTSSQ